MLPGNLSLTLEPPEPIRKTAAIVCVDVVGYGLMTDEDEASTHRRLMFYLRTVMYPAVLRTEGRVLRTTGDGFIAEFSRAVDAAWCAVEIQAAITASEQSTSISGRPFQLRIGINFGQVIVDDDMVYGEVVNIAARLESLATPGCIFISESVKKQIQHFTDFEYQDFGYQSLKHVSAQVRIYRLSASSAGLRMRLHDINPIVRGVSFIGAPSLAVMPLSIDDLKPSQAILGTRLQEAIAARLSAWRCFRVVKPSFPSDLTHLQNDPIHAARALDVRYVLKAKIRNSGKVIQFAIELVDGVSGYQLWSTALQRPADRFLALEDEIVGRVGAAIDLEVQKLERDRAISKSPDRVDMYDLVQRGYWHYTQRTTRHNNQALRLFGEALERNPTFAAASTGLAACFFWAGQRRWVDDPKDSLHKGLSFARRAVLADHQYPMAHLLFGQNMLFLGQQEAGIAAAKHAIELNGSYAGAWAFLGHALTATGNFRAAVQAIKKAFRLTSHDSRRFMWLSNLAIAYFHLGEFDRALRAAEEAVLLQPNHWLSNQVAIATLGELDRGSESRSFIQNVRSDEPNTSLKEFANRLPYRRASDLNRVVNALERAGWDK